MEPGVGLAIFFDVGMHPAVIFFTPLGKTRSFLSGAQSESVLSGGQDAGLFL